MIRPGAVRLAAVAAVAAVAGCATGPTLEQRLQPLVGRSEGDLVAALGVPDRTYEADDRRFLTFLDQRSYIMAGEPFLDYRSYGRYGPYFAPPYYVNRVCEITFTVRAGRTDGYSLRGGACR